MAPVTRPASYPVLTPRGIGVDEKIADAFVHLAAIGGADRRPERQKRGEKKNRPDHQTPPAIPIKIVDADIKSNRLRRQKGGVRQATADFDFSARLRSLGSRKVLRNRMDFGVTSTSSSSWI